MTPRQEYFASLRRKPDHQGRHDRATEIYAQVREAAATLLNDGAPRSLLDAVQLLQSELDSYAFNLNLKLDYERALAQQP